VGFENHRSPPVSISGREFPVILISGLFPDGGQIALCAEVSTLPHTLGNSPCMSHILDIPVTKTDDKTRLMITLPDKIGWPEGERTLRTGASPYCI